MRVISSLVLLIAVGLGAVAAQAQPEGACCACVEASDPAILSGNGHATPALELALFCGAFADLDPAGQKCTGLGGTLRCILEAKVSTTAAVSDECRDLLTQEGVACPTGAGAPAATPWGLAALAAGLAGMGIAAARRRRSTLPTTFGGPDA